MQTWNNTSSGSQLIVTQLRRVYERIKPHTYQLFTAPWKLLEEARRLWEIEWKTHLIQALAVYLVYEAKSSLIQYPAALRRWMDKFAVTNTSWALDSKIFLKDSHLVVIFAHDTFQLLACTLGAGHSCRLIDFGCTKEDEVKLWCLDQIWQTILEIHQIYTVASSRRMAKELQLATDKYLNKTHPLRPMILYVNQQLHQIKDVARQYVDAEARTLPLQNYQERLMFSREYFDVKKRIKQRCETRVVREPVLLDSEEREKYNQPQLVVKQTHPLYQQLMNERPMIHTAFLQLFDDLSMTTNENVEFERWAVAIQTHLKISPKALEIGCDYRAFYLLSDLLQLLALHRQQLRLMDQQHYDGLEEENCYSLYTRVAPWRSNDMLKFIRQQTTSTHNNNNKRTEPIFCRKLSAITTQVRRTHPLHAVRQQRFTL